ncbi:MAG TPA: coenzyme F420-0:L-glutamate ligase, partial [Anaerolineae bacterium]|nr:coenzyme F420-0:L-glutamate ligase [Anaerolineae bacterium]
MLNKLSLFALPNVPEVLPGDDVGALMCEWLAASEITLQPHDIIVIAQKIISKAEDRYVYFRDVVPSKRAEQVALEVDKGARLVELILSESDEISRMRKGVLVVRHRLGFVSANAGIDRSNVPQDCERERVLLLPV